MDTLDEKELRSFLLAWEVCDPGEALVDRTVHLMREELVAQTRTAPSMQQPWLLGIIGLALLLTVNLFYMLTLGSILRLALPPMFTTYLSQSLVAFSVAECCLIAGAIMVFFFKSLRFSGAGAEDYRVADYRVAHGLR